MVTSGSMVSEPDVESDKQQSALTFLAYDKDIEVI